MGLEAELRQVPPACYPQPTPVTPTVWWGRVGRDEAELRRASLSAGFLTGHGPRPGLGDSCGKCFITGRMNG